MSKYNFELEITPDSMIEKIMNRIRPGSRVLEFGCAEGRMTRYMATELGCRVCTVELDPEACRVAATWAERYFCGDLEQASWQNFYEREQFDYLLFADVLEHLRDPEAVLSKAKTLLKEDGEVLISIPNIAHHDVLANLINDRFSYTSIGLLDDTHVHFWGRNNLEDFAARCGFCLRVLDGVNAGVYSTEQAGEDRLPPVLEECLSHRPNNTVYQYFLVLTKSENPGTFEDRLSKPRPEWQAAFYWDMGEGYSQERLTYAMPVVLPDGAVLFSDIPVPAHCEKLRFDPTEGICCLVSNLRCTIDGMDHAPLSANGMPVPSGTLFLTEDPQYEFAVPNHASAVTIGAYIRRLSQAETEDLRILTEDSLKIRSLALENQKLFDQLQGECLRVEQLSNEIKLAKQHQEQTEAENQQLSQENSRLLGDFRNLEDGYRTLENGYWALENAYNRVLNSRSYRITAPLRMIVAAVKGTRVGRKLYQGLWCLKHLGLRVTAGKVLGYVSKKLGWMKNLLNFQLMKSLLKKTWKSLRSGGIRATMARISGYRRHKQFQQLTCAEELVIMDTIGEFLDACVKNGGEVFHADALRNRKNGVVLLVSHELNLTGAPIALEYFALCLKESGVHPLFFAPHDDVLRQRICEEGIPVATLPSVYHSNLVPSAAHLFDYIVVCTNVGAPLIAQLNGMSAPVLWWIHEARASYFPAAVEAMPETLKPNIHVYCGGKYAQRMLQEYRPSYSSKILLYYVDDSAIQAHRDVRYQLRGAEGKTVFAIIGMQEHRKGQDILIEAIRMLPPERLKECLFVFIGRECYPPIAEMIDNLVREYPENAMLIPQLFKEDLLDVYLRMDCLVCASRDDPMPIVVAEAMVLSKVVICSENTGYGQLLEETGGGLLYRQDSPEKLMECLMYVLEHKGNMQQIQTLARATYDRYFSHEQFVSNVSDAVYELKKMDHSIADFCNYFSQKRFGGAQEIFLKDQLCGFEKNGQRNILLISHEFSLTGAPVVLKDLARVLRKQGNNVVVLSPFDGAMREEFVKDGFPVILFEKVYLPENQNVFLQFVRRFHLVIANTVVTFRIIPFLGTINVPVIWWIHDSHASYHEGGFGKILPKEIPSNVRIRCGGSYAKKQLLDRYPQYQAEELLYGINDLSLREPDASKRIPVKEADKLLFICVGTFENRKGQDILAAAIRRLSGKDRERCRFLLIGRVLQDVIMQPISRLLEEMPDTVSYIPQVSRDALQWIYRDADCLICCSRDDPMPVVVTEMQSLSKLVICSENTGSASLIRQTYGGLVYENDSPDALADKIQYVLNLDDAGKEKICACARQTYQANFSPEQFEQTVRETVEQVCSIADQIAHTTVSVVIPCFNAGAQGADLMRKLNAQKGIGRLEVVCVDSGSSDGTQECFQSHGAKVIQISQSQFSHSYARHLGAENTSGSVVIFMTQDALPDSDEWAAKMIRPIVTREAVAVSCRENCPDTVDLYYRVASWANIRWIGIQEQDRIGQYRLGISPEELRKNASLNDVACAVDKNVFFRFGYRFGYAEDLDLGIRLLKSGFSIKVLHDPTIVHGHTRNAWYYLKRGFVESLALKKIMQLQPGVASAGEIVNRIMPGYIAVHNTIALINGMEFRSPLEFTHSFHLILKKQIEQKPTQMEEGWKREKEIEEFLHSLTSVVEKIGMEDMMLAHSIVHYLETVLLPCLRENNWVQSGISHAMCDCIDKQMALMIGNITADLDQTEEVFALIQADTKGV